jgi:hypothetical protein
MHRYLYWERNQQLLLAFCTYFRAKGTQTQFKVMTQTFKAALQEEYRAGKTERLPVRNSCR